MRDRMFDVNTPLPTGHAEALAGMLNRGHAKPTPKLRERDIERHLVQRVKALGGEVRKVQWIGRRGAPDRLVMLPPRWHYNRAQDVHEVVCTWWVELKAPGVKPEAHQLREHERMRAMGQRVVVIDSLEGVEELLR